MPPQPSRFQNLLARLRAWLFPGLPSPPSQVEANAAPAFDPKALFTDLFLRLRRAGFNLGVPELLAALRAVEGGWGATSLDELADVARLLWCKSPQEQVEFNIYWEQVAPGPAAGQPPDSTAVAPPTTPPGEDKATHPPAPPDHEPSAPALADLEPAPLPIRTPFTPATGDEAGGITTDWPLSRRTMLYAWRYLRRPLPDGPADVLDVGATVSQAASQGFYLAPVYRRRQRNHAHLILLVDQGGSMTPLHRLTRDLVESALSESNLQAVESYYFHNVPDESVYGDPHLTERIAVAQALQQCTSESSVLIVSDAGAARGARQMARVRATAHFLAALKEHTLLVAWLNPMPRARWANSSAQLIAGLVPMFPMEPDGLSNAIDRLRGQST
jgi:hypothetical protein